MGGDPKGEESPEVRVTLGLSLGPGFCWLPALAWGEVAIVSASAAEAARGIDSCPQSTLAEFALCCQMQFGRMIDW